MDGYNIIAVFNPAEDKLLMCRRRKFPYKGLGNLVGGKIEQNESGLEAAYRELWEETSITREDIVLYHLMDFTYYEQNRMIEVYYGTLNKEVDVHGEENDLFWAGADENFSDDSKYAGHGNIDHIVKSIRALSDKG